MTLADQIIEATGSRVDRELYLGGIGEMAADISRCERFVFHPDAVSACAQLASSRPSSLLEATKFCRVPFKKVWMEWDCNHWDHLILDNRPKGYNNHVKKPIKIGCVIECLDDTFRRFGIAYAWTHSRETMLGATMDTPVNPCPMGFVVNWHDKWIPNDLSDLTTYLRSPEVKIQMVGNNAKYASDEREKAAVRELLSNRIPTFVPYAKPMVDRIKARGDRMMLDKIVSYAAHDLEGEYQYVIAMLCLLSSRNMTEKLPSQLDKLNRARRRRGKLPLLSHSTVTINLSRQDAARAAKLGITGLQLRQHIVRGHFKIRRGGVFWWRPFLRGDADAGKIVRDGYSVKNQPVGALVPA